LPEIPAELNDRAADIWEPLFVLADLAVGHWPSTARKAAVNLTITAQETNPVGSLLLDIFVIFHLGETDRLFSRDLVRELNGLADRPWAEMSRGKPISELWLAQQLRPYGVKSRTIWIGETSAKGYVQEDFREIYKRYIPRSEVEALREAWGPRPASGNHEWTLIDTNFGGVAAVRLSSCRVGGRACGRHTSAAAGS
jgi:hypothetical protein